MKEGSVWGRRKGPVLDPRRSFCFSQRRGLGRGEEQGHRLQQFARGFQTTLPATSSFGVLFWNGPSQERGRPLRVTG